MAKDNTTIYLAAGAAALFLFRKQLGIGAYENVPNVHLFRVKFIGASNTRGSRVKITSLRFNQSVTIDWNYRYGSMTEQAVNYLEGKGFQIIGKGEAGGEDIIVSNTFEPIK